MTRYYQKARRARSLGCGLNCLADGVGNGHWQSRLVFALRFSFFDQVETIFYLVSAHVGFKLTMSRGAPFYLSSLHPLVSHHCITFPAISYENGCKSASGFLHSAMLECTWKYLGSCVNYCSRVMSYYPLQLIDISIQMLYPNSSCSSHTRHTDPFSNLLPCSLVMHGTPVS
jgi:hypothetical protein